MSKVAIILFFIIIASGCTKPNDRYDNNLLNDTITYDWICSVIKITTNEYANSSPIWKVGAVFNDYTFYPDTIKTTYDFGRQTLEIVRVFKRQFPIYTSDSIKTSFTVVKIDTIIKNGQPFYNITTLPKYKYVKDETILISCIIKE